MAHTNKNADEKRTNTDAVAFFRSKTPTYNSCRSLDYAGGNESIIYFTDLCKAIEIYIYARKKHPFASYSKADIPQKTSFINTVDFSSRNNFPNLGSFAKVSIPVKIYNSLHTIPALHKEL